MSKFFNNSSFLKFGVLDYQTLLKAYKKCHSATLKNFSVKNKKNPILVYPWLKITWKNFCVAIKKNKSYCFHIQVLFDSISLKIYFLSFLNHFLKKHKNAWQIVFIRLIYWIVWQAFLDRSTRAICLKTLFKQPNQNSLNHFNQK